MAEIKFSPEAITDLQQTKAYITEELCNEQAAINTVTKITKESVYLPIFLKVVPFAAFCVATQFYYKIFAMDIIFYYCICILQSANTKLF